MNPITSLSDRALKILVIILLAGQPVSREYILAAYRRPIGKDGFQLAIKELEADQLITRIAYRGNAFAASTNARQMILGESYPQSYPQKTATYPQGTTESPPSGTSSSATRTFNHLDSSSSRCNAHRTDELPLLLDASESPRSGLSRHEENRAALAEYGIHEPALSQLAALPHVTPALVDAHCSRVRAEGKEVPVAIYRIRNNWKPGPAATDHLSKSGKARGYLTYLE